MIIKVQIETRDKKTGTIQAITRSPLDPRRARELVEQGERFCDSLGFFEVVRPCPGYEAACTRELQLMAPLWPGEGWVTPVS